MSSDPTPLMAKAIASLCSSLQTSLGNMSASIRCIVCQCSYTDAVQLPCVHVFCRSCIKEFLPGPCPICKAPATHRSMKGRDDMDQMVLAVKRMLRVFGLAPFVYDASVTAMTQHVNHAEGAHLSIEEMEELLNVSRIQHHFLSEQPGESSSFLPSIKSRKAQQATVVAANEKALQVAYGDESSQSSQGSSQSGRSDPSSSNLVAEQWHGRSNLSVDTDRGAADETLAIDTAAENSSNESKRQKDHRKSPDVNSLANSLYDSPRWQAADVELAQHSPAGIKEGSPAISTKSQSPEGMTGQSLFLGPDESLEEDGSSKGAVARKGTEEVNEVDGQASNVDIDNGMSLKDNEPTLGQQSDDEMESQSCGPTENSPKNLVHLGSPVLADQRALKTNTATKRLNRFTLGEIVQVEARTWPGINKHGGIGRITKVHTENNALSYDISYVLGGKETRVDAVFVSPCDAGDGTGATQSPLGTSITGAKDTSDENSRRRTSRRIADYRIPTPLLKGLAAEGFDVGKENLRLYAQRSPSTKKQGGDLPMDSEPQQKRKRSVTSKTTSISLPEEPTDDVCRLADQWYSERFNAALAGSSINIVVSSLSENDLSQLKDLCSRSKRWNATIKLSDNFHSSKPTLVIHPAAPGPRPAERYLTAATRRPKAMLAALAGVQIVTPAWVADCLRGGTVAPPSAVRTVRALPAPGIGDDGPVTCGVARLAAARRRDPESQLLQGVSVLVCGTLPAKEGRDVAALLRAAGATVLSGAPAATRVLLSGRRLVCLCPPETEIPRALEAAVRSHRDRARVVGHKWLYDCISCGVVFAGDGYPPKEGKARELWQSTLEQDSWHCCNCKST